MSRRVPVDTILVPRAGRGVSALVMALITAVAIVLSAFGASASPSGGSVRGTVVDPAAQVVAAARVTLRSAAGVTRDVRTDDGGRFSFEHVQPGTYELVAIVDGFRADTTRVSIRDGVSTSVTLSLRLSAVTETLVVSSSLVETPLSQSPAGTVAVSARDMEARQLVTVADALRLAPGSAVAANGGAGSVTSVFPRGGESDFTLVLVDGVKLNSFGGGFDFGHLTTGGLASVEVVRGPQSAVFGADAIGGVIQARTAIGGPIGARASIESGGYGLNRVAAGSTGSAGTFRWGAYAERIESDGWTTEAPGTNTRVSNDAYDATSLVLAAAWRPARATTVRLDSRYATNERGYPGPFGSNPIGAFPGIDTVSRGRNQMVMGTVSVTHEWNPSTALRVRGSGMQLDSDFASLWGDSMSATRRWSAHAQIDRAFGSAFSTSFGVDTAHETAESTYITDASASRVPVERQVTGYFAEGRLRAGSRLSLTGGLRLEHIVRSTLGADPWSFTPRPELPGDTILSPNPRIAASYHLRTSAESAGNWSRLHASAGTGIRAPDAFEIAFTDNAGLKPERSRSIDAGVEQSLFGGLVVLDVSAYSNSYDDLIVAVGRSFANASQYLTDNIANARSRGVELSGAWRTRAGLETRVAYTFVDSAVLAVDRAGEAPPPFSVGDPLIRRPRHQVSVDVLFTRRAWSAYVRAAGRGRVLDVEPNYGAYGGLFHAAGYTVVDAGGSLKLGRFAEVIARLDNLTDRQYESALGYPAPRRTFTVGVRLAAGR